MKIVVTGAAGKAGRWVVRELLAAGYEVIASDKKLTEESPAENFIQADLRDYGQACQLIMGADAVVHLAAIPTDIRNTPQAIFENNMIVNFNVFEACKDWSVGKVVWASSETVLGYPFGAEFLHYVPLDEEHPVAPRSAYAMAKLLTEHLAGMYTDLAGMQIVGLRFANMLEPDDYLTVAKRWTPQEEEKQKVNLWAYTDARDAALACRLALEKDNLGAAVFHITAADSIMRQASADLVNRHFPGIPFKRPLEGNETCMSIDKARRVLGYSSQHSWRDVVDENGAVKEAPSDPYALANP